MKLKRGLQTSLRYFIRKFYTLNYHVIIRGHERGQLLSIFLILGKEIIFLLLGIYNQEYSNIASVDSNMKALSNNDYLNRWQTYTYADLIQSFCLVLNLILIVYLLCCYLDFLWFGYKNLIQPATKSSFPYNSSLDIDEDQFIVKLNKKMQVKIYEIMSIYISTYEFLLSTPILYYSLIQIEHPLAPINLLLALVSGTLIIDSDFDYSINSSDFMSKPYSPYNVIIYYLDFLIMLLIIKTNFNIDTLLLGIYFLVNGWFSSQVCTYYKMESIFWNTFSYFYCGALCLTFYFSYQASQKTSMPSLMIVILMPIFYKLTQYFCDLQNKTHNNLLKEIFEEKNKISLINIDRIIRLQIFKNLMTSKINDSEKVDIYNLIIKKKEQFQNECQKQLSTQKSTMLSLKILIDEIVNGQNEDQSLLQFFKEQIQTISMRGSEQKYKVVFLIYLLEIIKCWKAYFFEFQQIRNQKLNVKQEQIIMATHINFLKQRQILQQTLMIENNFDQSFYSVLEYEEKINKTYKMIDFAMKLKVEFIFLLKNKKIQSLDLIKQLKELRKIQLKVRNNINELTLINNLNRDLISLQVCYLATLSFSEKDLIIDVDLSYLNDFPLSQANSQLMKQQFKIRKKYANQLQINKQIQQISQLEKFNLFDKHSCIIFSQVDQNSNLIIKKTSQNFSHIFGLSEKEIFDNQVEVIMPPKIPVMKKHKQYIVSYFQSQDNGVCFLRNTILFGYNQKGFIFPMRLDIRLNQCNGLDTTGLTAFVQQIYDQYEYILFESNSLRIVGVTKSIQFNIFLKNDISLHKQTDLGQFFPFLYKLKQKSANKQLEKLDQTIVNSKKENSLKDLLSDQIIQQISAQQIEEESFENFQLKDEEFLLIIQTGRQKSNYQDQINLNDFSFYLMEVSVVDCQYKDINNLYYLKLNNIKHISQDYSQSVILKYLNEYNEFYVKIFTKNTLDNLQIELQAQYLKMNSLEMNKQLQHQRQSLLFQNQFHKIPSNQLEQIQLSNNNYEQSHGTQSDIFMQSPKKSKQLHSNNFHNNLIYQIQEENSQIVAQSEYQSDTIQKSFQVSKEQMAELNNTNSDSPNIKIREIIEQDFQVNGYQDYLNYQEQNNYIIPLTTNRKDTNRELINENNILSLNNIEEEKQLNSKSKPEFYKSDQSIINTPKSDQQISKNNFNQKLVNENMKYLSNQEMTYQKSFENTQQITSQQKFYQDQEIFSNNFINMYETKETFQKDSSKKGKQHYEKVKQIQVNNYNPSSISRESSSSTKKRLIKTISRQTNIQAVKVIILFGILTYTSLSIITIQQYFNLMNSIESMNSNLNSQDWPYEIQNQISRSVYNLNFLQIERQNNFTFSSKQVQKSFDTYLFDQLKQSQSEFIKLIQIMDRKQSGKMLFEKISYYETSFYIDHLYPPNNLTNTSSRRTAYYFEEKNSSLLYSFIFINYYIYEQSINPTGKLQEIWILRNINNIVEGIKQTQQYFQNYQSQQVGDIQKSLTLQIELILIISALCLMTALPLYAYVQRRKDQILLLFCTFPLNQLQNMVSNIRLAYYENKVMISHVKNIPNEIQMLIRQSYSEQSNQKKQTLSQIINLPIFNYSLFIALCLAYVLLSFYPIFNRLFIDKYLDNLNNNLMMLGYLNKARSYILQSASIISFAFDMKVYPEAKIAQMEDFLPQIQSATSQVDSLFANLTIVSDQFALTGSFFNFILQIKSGTSSNNSTISFSLCLKTICYLEDASKFNLSSCKAIYQGFLQKGLKISIKQFTQKLLDLNTIVNIEDDNQLQTALQELFNTFNLYDYYNLIYYLDEFINTLKQFLLTNSRENYDYVKQVQLILIIIQLLLQLLIFGVCWYLFSSIVAQQITKIKHHLQVINVNHLLENTFILNFVKKNVKL